MSWSRKVKEDALVACGRYCCICHKFCGIKIELHHIIPQVDGGENTFENCIPLCFDCHADMSSYDFNHPKGTKYSTNELNKHRENWYETRKISLISQSNKYLEVDKILYDKLIELLPWNGSISFVRQNNFAGFSFSVNKLNNLYDFCQECENPAFEFIDIEMEDKRKYLLEKIEEFLTIIGHETFPVFGKIEVNIVPPEWEIEQGERFRKVFNGLHTLAEKICECYDSLVKIERRKSSIVNR